MELQEEGSMEEMTEQERAEALMTGGILEIVDDGYGFLRGESLLPGNSDVYVSQSQIRRFGLRTGDYVRGHVRPPKDSEKYYGLLRVEDVNGLDAETAKQRPHFENLTAIFPNQMVDLEIPGNPDMTGRLINLISPIGRGQRGLIVSPPKAGKTFMLKAIAAGVAHNYPDIHLMVALIGERPEEVTDMKRCVKGEVVASSLDRDVESHVRLSQLVVERCKRMTEQGKDVFLLMDSITRMARAFNKWVGNTGRTMSGGVDIKAMDIPKKLFATARLFEEGGSLTIVATALIDTGSRMDELIFQEFKGTGNMELVLDRKLADRRIWPAIDITQSGTRREEKLLDPETLHAVTMLRRTLTSMHHVDAMEQLTQKLGKFKSNAEFIKLISGAKAMD
jgi:transcription termination factor Rho